MHSSPAPRVTVLMAFHNDERHLAVAIDSVVRQTFADFEVVLIDDGSTDGSPAIASSFADPRIRLLRLDENRGLVAALNHGLRASRGEYVARLDADDYSFPTRLAQQVAFLDAHLDVAVVGSQAMSINVRGQRMRRVALWNAQWHRPADGNALAWYRMFDTPFVHSSVMFRRAAVEQLGGYDERHPITQDADLWMRLGRSHALANLEVALVAHRFHRSSMTADPARPERVSYPERRVPICDELLRVGLRWDGDAPSRIASMWVAANNPWSPMPAAKLRELAEALETCAERFFALHPDARNDGRIARHRASMLARLIEKADFGMALRWFGAMFRLRADVALAALPRFAVHALCRRFAWVAKRRSPRYSRPVKEREI